MGWAVLPSRRISLVDVVLKDVILVLLIINQAFHHHRRLHAAVVALLLAKEWPNHLLLRLLHRVSFNPVAVAVVVAKGPTKRIRRHHPHLPISDLAVVVAKEVVEVARVVGPKEDLLRQVSVQHHLG